MGESRQIVCFGGTFDPVHNGHLIVARSLAEQRGFERIVLVPAGLPPHKGPATASAGQRLEMLRLATAGEPLFEISEIEIHRQGPSFTYDTLAALQQQFGPGAAMNWVIGADMLADLPNWHRANDVLHMARILVALRPPWNASLDGLFDNLKIQLDLQEVEQLAASVVAVPLVEISSSEIRRRRAAGLSIRYMVPDAVQAYISEHGLYS